jgi:acyl dehydratase
VVVGASYRTGSRTITRSDIAAFAELTGDRTPIHLDEEFCRSGPFGKPIAHGIFGAALMSGLKSQLHLYDVSSIAALGWADLRYKTPLLADATVFVEATYAAKRISRSNPGRGVVTEHVRLLTDDLTTISEGMFSIMLRARGHETAAQATDTAQS